MLQVVLPDAVSTRLAPPGPGGSGVGATVSFAVTGTVGEVLGSAPPGSPDGAVVTVTVGLAVVPVPPQAAVSNRAATSAVVAVKRVDRCMPGLSSVYAL
ncbi:hypothetical protein TTY48_18790 [Tsukamurella sp. TY48]|nr:hypothetical protein TTY48_18790 [Tsukamurella sp. TY48]